LRRIKTLRWSSPLVDNASSVWSDYVGDHANAIRRHANPRQLVTTNSTLWNDNFDRYQVHRALDIAAWDEYVPDGHPRLDSAGAPSGGGPRLQATQLLDHGNPTRAGELGPVSGLWIPARPAN
jgi:hypothetical protein